MRLHIKLLSISYKALLICLFANPLFAAEQPQQSEALSGELEVVHIDDFQNKRGEFQYFLNPGGQAVPIRLDFKGKRPVELVAGSKISLKGLRHGRVFEVEAVAFADGDGSGITTDAYAPAANVHHAVVMLVDMNDAPSGGTVSGAANQMFYNTHSVDGSHQASSYGQSSFPDDTDGDGQADVFGPFAINANAADSCDYYDWAYKADAIAEKNGVDLSLYKHRVYILPNHSQLSKCGWGGVGNLSCGSVCRAWIAVANDGTYYNHEIGHNLAMHHAATDSDNNGSVDSEYGDHSGIMGGNSTWVHVNAPHKVQMGWFDAYPGSILELDKTESGDFLLSALELDPRVDNPGTQVMKHARAAGGFYYVSFRQDFSVYASKSTYAGKLSIHSFAGGSNKTLLIRTLNAGESFSDSSSGFAVKFSDQSADGLTATVAITSSGSSSNAVCTPANPSFSLSPANQSGSPGEQFTYNLNVKNNDSSDCASTSFNLATNTGSLVSSLSSSGLSLAPGANGTVTLKVNTAIDSSDGSYKFTSSLSSNNHSSANTTGMVNLDGSAPTAPTNLNGSAKRKALSLSWSASTDAVSGVAYYRVFRNGMKIAQRSTADYSDRDLVSGSSYSYTVDAVDNAGNVSTASNTFSYAASSGGGSNGKKPSK